MTFSRTRGLHLAAVLMCLLAVAQPATAKVAPSKPAAPWLSWSGSNDQGFLAVNDTRDFTMTLTNTGGSAARGVAFSSGTGTNFTTVSDGCSGVSLRAGKNCNVTFRFHPTSSGTYSRTIGATSKTTGTNSFESTLLGISGSTLSGAVSIDAGSGQTCIVTTAGAVKCWGYGDSGRVGNNSTTNAPIAVPVSGITAGATAVSAGGGMTCAIVAGADKCWGVNWTGQLGNNDSSVSNSTVPVQVYGMTSGVTSIATGDDHACAVQSGALYCWGANGSHELGVDTSPNDYSYSPVQVIASGVSKVAAGTHHTCAIMSDKTAMCWGANGNGQVGNGATDPATRGNDVTTPVAVVGLANVEEMWIGEAASCARLTSGAVKCWGSDSSGQLGDDYANTASWTPVQVYLLDGSDGQVATALAMSHNSICALKAATTVNQAVCWGNNGDGQLGFGDRTSRAHPMLVPAPLNDNVAALSIGWQHACAIMSDSKVNCWGQGTDGQLGSGDSINRLGPAYVME